MPLTGLNLRDVAVFRALQIGDLLCTVPALRALRGAYPGARVTLIGLPWARDFAKRFDSYLDDYIEFPGFPGLPEVPWRPSKVLAFLAEVQERRFDLAIQMHGSGTQTNPLVLLLGARAAAGCFEPGAYCPDPHRFMPYPASEPEVRRWLRLMEFLGVTPRGEHLEFPLGPDDLEGAAALQRRHRLTDQGYVCLHPGARDPRRRWAPDQFARAADALAAGGLRVVLTGSGEERPLTAAVASRMAGPATDLAGQTQLGSLAALLRGARALVCNDTGVSHLAAALDVPSVTVFTASDPRRWAPLDTRMHRAVGSGVSSAGTPEGTGPGWESVVTAARELPRKESIDAA